MSEFEKCRVFLSQNGWQQDTDDDSDIYAEYNKPNCLSVELNECDGTMVFIADEGDILHLHINIYTLIGALIEFRQISFNYTSVRFIGN